MFIHSRPPTRDETDCFKSWNISKSSSQCPPLESNLAWNPPQLTTINICERKIRTHFSLSCMGWVLKGAIYSSLFVRGRGRGKYLIWRIFSYEWLTMTKVSRNSVVVVDPPHTRRGLRLKNRFYIILYSLFEERDLTPPRISTAHVQQTSKKHWEKGGRKSGVRGTGTCAVDILGGVTSLSSNRLYRTSSSIGQLSWWLVCQWSRTIKLELKQYHIDYLTNHISLNLKKNSVQLVHTIMKQQ